MNIKAIIFDWGRTLFDPEIKKELPESKEILLYCKERGYKICVASLVRTGTTLDERTNQIESLPLKKYIDMFEVSEDKEKGEILDKLVKKLNLPKEEILLVDDRTVKSIKYGNRNGHPTVWLQNGKFANELPNTDTGIPTYTIKSLLELKNII
ncbi:MAG: HAD family hydrolase [Patescibacteria group bacterium]